MSDTRSEYVQGPITLHVKSVNFKPVVNYQGERITVIDLEITELIAEKIIKELTDRLDSDILLGAIRIRFSGRLAL